MDISFLVQLFIIILLSPTNVTHADQRLCMEHEKTLLLELKNQLVFNSSYSTYLVQWNNATDDCCSWNGVGCDDAGHVIGLELFDEGISGGFNESSSLFGLKYLEVLDLSNNANLSASLPDSISNLQRLSVLNLSHCEFSGVIPSTLSNLTQLSILDLADNFFSGSISSIHFEALSNVSNVDLSYNSLNGTIPTSIFTLPSLRRLDLQHNQFSGQVNEFAVVNSSHQFSSLSLSSNRLESPIPDSFFNLPSLATLDLSDNLFNDSFRLQKILSFPILTYLDLSNNNLSLASTSNDFPVKQSSLHSLDLSNNKIAGEVPSWIWEIGNGSLTYLNLSCNMLEGLQKPYNILTTSLDVLDLHSNRLRGQLPLPPQGSFYVDYSDNYFDNFIPHTQSFSSSKLLFLSVANNNLSGPFPAFICNCTNLQVLDLSLNNLSGIIPPCLFQNVTPLKVLNLGRNNFSGRIPDNISLGCVLRTLDLSHNNLVGDVPLSLQNCTSLAVMNVGKNHIEDNFPCMLPSTLQVLVLRSNRFNGEIRCNMTSWPNLQIIDIASNNFTGDLKTLNFSSWRGMMLDSGEAGLTRNNLGVTVEAVSYKNVSNSRDVGYSRHPATTTTGYASSTDEAPARVPSSTTVRASTRDVGYYRDVVNLTIKGLELKLVKIWPEFTSIDFSCNNLHGDIPQAIGELNSLYLLNLSHNSLQGTIPKSFGKLRQLGALDLSMNQLAGEIPHDIAGLTFLQQMNISHNNLRGKIPVGTQIQSFSADSFEGNAGLCGLPLSKSCSSTDVPPPNVGNVEDSGTEEIEWEYVFAAAGYAVGLGCFLWMLLFCRSFRYKYFEKVDGVVYKILDFCQYRKRKHGGTRKARK